MSRNDLNCTFIWVKVTLDWKMYVVHPLPRGCTYLGLMGIMGYLGSTTDPDQGGNPTWDGGTSPGQGVYSPWIDGYYSISWQYHQPWPGGDPTLDGGYIPRPGVYLPWINGHYGIPGQYC